MISSDSALLAWGLTQFGAMKFDTSGDAQLQPLSLWLNKKHLTKFAANGALDARLSQIDENRPIQRIFIMGCGRSGTWLLTAIMSTFKDTCVVAKEVPVEFFAQLTTTGDTLVLKRNNISFKRLPEIPERIKIAYAIRHPYDVLTSHNPMSERTYHIDPERWLGETTALRAMLETKREHVCIIRYEDIVADAGAVQEKLRDAFGLRIGSSVEDLPTVFKTSREANVAMHGLRRIDSRSLHKYRSDPEKIAYLKSLKPQLGDTLEWVAAQFDYDINLDELQLG